MDPGIQIPIIDLGGVAVMHARKPPRIAMANWRPTFMHPLPFKYPHSLELDETSRLALAKKPSQDGRPHFQIATARHRL